MGKSEAQKSREAWRQPTIRQSDRNYQLQYSQWLNNADWSSPSRRPVEEMGVLPGGVTSLARTDKINGRLYFMRGEEQGEVRIRQANVYTLGNTGVIPGELTVDILQHRIKTCPLLAAGSLDAPLKLPGGHASDRNIKCRLVLNFSLIFGFSIHKDQEHKTDATSTIGHAWVMFS